MTNFGRGIGSFSDHFYYLFQLDGFPDERDLPHTLHAGEGGGGGAGEGVEAPAGVTTQPTDRRLEVEQ